MSGVDATGSFNVGISFPGPLELRDIVLASISVDTGLRAMNVLSAVALNPPTPFSRRHRRRGGHGAAQQNAVAANCG